MWQASDVLYYQARKQTGKIQTQGTLKKNIFGSGGRGGGRGCSPHNPQISQYYTETLSHLEEFPHLSLNYPNQSTIFITHFQNTSLQTQFFKKFPIFLAAAYSDVQGCMLFDILFRLAVRQTFTG